MLGAQGGPLGRGHVVAGEHRQHAIADQLEHVAAGLMDGVDRGLRIVVEKRNDLAGADGFADRGRAAQIGKPQHRLDALGDAPRDSPTHHLLGGVAPEIDPAERSGDLDLGGGLDREPQRRHEVAQRRQIPLPKPSARRVTQ